MAQPDLGWTRVAKPTLLVSAPPLFSLTHSHIIGRLCCAVCEAEVCWKLWLQLRGSHPSSLLPTQTHGHQDDHRQGQPGGLIGACIPSPPIPPPLKKCQYYRRGSSQFQKCHSYGAWEAHFSFLQPILSLVFRYRIRNVIPNVTRTISKNILPERNSTAGDAAQQS